MMEGREGAEGDDSEGGDNRGEQVKVNGSVERQVCCWWWSCMRRGVYMCGCLFGLL